MAPYVKQGYYCISLRDMVNLLFVSLPFNWLVGASRPSSEMDDQTNFAEIQQTGHSPSYGYLVVRSHTPVSIQQATYNDAAK